jgi:hypothetical protein
MLNMLTGSLQRSRLELKGINIQMSRTELFFKGKKTPHIFPAFNSGWHKEELKSLVLKETFLTLA